MVTDPSTTAPKSASLVEILRWRAIHQSDQPGYTFLADGETEEIRLSYGELDRQARTIASRLQGLELGQHSALLLYAPGLEYIAAFMGCLYAGWAAVPCYPPRRNRPDSRLQTIAQDSGAVVALTTQSIFSGMERRLAHNPGLQSLQWIATDSLSTSDPMEQWRDPHIESETLAFLQYTSGSTSDPKGVMISHGNLMHNSELIRESFGLTTASRLVSWLPPHHDMGLIGGILQPLYSGYPATILAPFDFIQRPVRWLQAISRCQATVSGAPDFAYDLCVRRISAEQKRSLDLSSWDVAFSGAEPVRHETLKRFSTAFAPCGFRWDAFYPCYGLAEATLMVSGGSHTAPPVIRSVQKSSLEDGRVVPTQVDDSNGQNLVGCGQTLSNQTIRIIDPQTLAPCTPDRVGEIWVSGASVAQGYWDRPAETESAFRAFVKDTQEGPYLRTGDLGFLQDGELFITGRLKDLIIVDGRNHYPQDIELTVEKSHPAVSPGCVAAFSVDVESREQLIVVAEVRRGYRPDTAQQKERSGSAPGNVSSPGREEMIKAIRQAVSRHHDLRVHDIVLLKAWTIPKTSSGKIQRHACRARYLAGTLEEKVRW